MRSNRSRRRWVSLILLAVALAATSSLGACVRGARGIPTSDTVTIEVENRNYLDVVIYALQGSSRVRIGQVTGTSRGSFDVSLRQISTGGGDVRFLADPVGSSRVWTTEQLHLTGGQIVELYVESDVGRSTLSIRG